MTESKSRLKAAGIRWNLSGLYAGPDDKRIENDLETVLDQAEKFNQEFHGRISNGNLNAGELLGAIEKLEAINTNILRPEIYAFLAFSANTADPALKALVSRCQEMAARVRNLVLFFDLEIQKMDPEKLERLLAGGKLERYRHYLEGIRLFRPHTLSEKEEQIINKKDLSGKLAFVNFHEEFTSSFVWELEVDGERKQLTAEEMRNLLRRPEADLRERAKRAYDGRFGENVIIFENVLNAIAKDHALEMEMRGYDSPILPTHLRNRIAPEVVETMMEVTSAHYPLAQEYYTLKAKLLRMPKLRGCDLVAPVVEKRETIPFGEGKRIVLEAFETFSPDLAGHARQMFDNKWIDAEVRTSKRHGAYCEGTVPQHHPYILMSYSDDIENVYTLAHELGHAIHDFLAGRKQTLFNYHPPLVAAETASVFAEMLLTRKLLSEVSDRQFRLAILTGKLEDLFATISRQNFYTLFELDVHRAGGRHRLSAAELCELWTKRRDEMYGQAIDFLAEQKWYWAAIPHFINYRFYCYAYTFGALLVLSLFSCYEKEGESFVPRYLRMLETGGSQTPEKMIEQMGFDIRQAEFWEQGFAVIQRMLNDLRALIQ